MEASFDKKERYDIATRYLKKELGSVQVKIVEISVAYKLRTDSIDNLLWLKKVRFLKNYCLLMLLLLLGDGDVLRDLLRNNPFLVTNRLERFLRVISVAF